MPFEKTQKGNPYALTVNQHIVSKAHIKRFESIAGHVEVFLPEHESCFRTKPCDEVFCAKRVWDQKTESIRMKHVEDEFMAELDMIDETGLVSNNVAVSEYFALWAYRASIGYREQEDIQLVGISGSGLSRQEEEILESKGAAFVRDGGKVPSRFGAGIDYMISRGRQRAHIEAAEWKLLECEDELVLGDTPFGPFIPISPYQALTLVEADRTDAAWWNSQFIAQVQRWYLRCPTDSKSP